MNGFSDILLCCCSQYPLLNTVSHPVRPELMLPGAENGMQLHAPHVHLYSGLMPFDVGDALAEVQF